MQSMSKHLMPKHLMPKHLMNIPSWRRARQFARNLSANLLAMLFAPMLFIIAFGGASPALAAEYRVDPAHSFVQFRTQHLGFSWLVGRFNRFDGVFNYDAGNAAGPTAIKVTLETASVDSNHAERDKHLRGEDFLHVKKYPQATFVSDGDYNGDANGGQLRGNLTLHGVTRPVSIAVTKIGEGKDPWGGYRVGFEGKLVITRRDFGMNYDLGPMAEKVELNLYIEGIRR